MILSISDYIEKYGTEKTITAGLPHAWLAVKGYANLNDNRWDRPYRGRIFIHASATIRPEWKNSSINELPFEILGKVLNYMDNKAAYDRGRIIGAATIEDCLQNERGGWDLVLKDPVKFPGPFIKGRLGIFDLSLHETTLIPKNAFSRCLAFATGKSENHFSPLIYPYGDGWLYYGKWDDFNHSKSDLTTLMLDAGPYFGIKISVESESGEQFFKVSGARESFYR